jgi:DNA topoisomerase-2
MTDIAKKYQRQTDIEHVLSNPGMYVGDTGATRQACWLYDENIHKKEIDFHAALYKIIDEPLTNCYDHYVRCKGSDCPVTAVEIEITSNTMTIQNDGEGIDVEIHPETKLYVPEMIFGSMRTSTNYNVKKRVTGGLHGLGVKLTAIWSKVFSLTVLDEIRGLKFSQEFRDNLNVKSTPRIVKSKAPRGLTRITFEPDFERFQLAAFPEYMESLVRRRAYDLSILMPQVKLKFNGKLLPKRTFKHYVTACFTPCKFALHEDDNWKVAACYSENGFRQLSMVNGISTANGGRHVDYALTALLTPLRKMIQEKQKVDIQARALKEQIALIVICNIVNPKFGGQVKDSLLSGTPVSSLSIEPDFVDKLFKLVGAASCSIFKAKERLKKDKEDQKLLSAGNGAKTRAVRGVPQLTDANLAGTAQSGKTVLILCEGESAATGVLSGLSSKDRDFFGVYPLRGKLINPQDKGADKIAANKIIVDLKKILGLESGKDYTSTTRLRYGQVVFMTDQDLDGHHIKALGLNVFYSLWHSLIRQPRFFGFIQTPIIKARKGKAEKIFYHEKEFREWKEKEHASDWVVKYYKGLGTNTATEFKQYFSKVKIVYFDYQAATDQAFKMVFSKDAGARKLWLSQYDKNLGMSIAENRVAYEDFINGELIHFSKYDCERSIPSIDGLKPSQRKILYTALIHLSKEMKVAQFCGRVAEITRYHHGESNLENTVVGMAQDFVGSNNLNLLLPLGQFGSRRSGGEDSASSRYIFTKLNPLTRLIYKKEDEPVLEYLEDDGHQIEPRHYIPIIPTILINGAVGIGTGFSCTVLAHDALDIIKAVRAALADLEIPKLQPYFRGFRGTIESLSEGKYRSKGVYKLDEKTRSLTITELPVGVWNITFKTWLEDLLQLGQIESYSDGSTDTDVLFKVILSPRDTWSEEQILQIFKQLVKSHNEINMHLFDFDDKLRKFLTPEEIISYYVPVRIEYYVKRKHFILADLKQRISVLRNKVRYVCMILDQEISLNNTKRAIEEDLRVGGFDLSAGSYDYLLNMPIISLCAERVAALEQNLQNLEEEHASLEKKTPQDLWLAELDELERALISN